MELEFKQDVEVENENSTSIKAKISEENLPFIIDLITRQQYRDPIGSIVREITSNCFDAQVEEESQSPVIIKFADDDLGNFISFRDYGCGLNIDRIQNVYLNYGESTKRNTNKLIGGFGLGAKSPLAYTNSFYVTTTVEGYSEIETRETKLITYEYIVYQGEELPEIELLNIELETNIKKGTEVKIYFKDNSDYITYTGDGAKFLNACKSQLTYFENIIFQPNWVLNNKYQIIEGKTFKVRSDVSKERYSDYIHLCIGKVAYPIDYNILGIDPIKIPIALKFEIGDLKVTPERESVRYVKVNDKDTKDIILEKLSDTIDELRELYNKQKSLKAKSLTDYLRRRKDAPTLTIPLQNEELVLNLNPIIKNNNITYSLLDGFIGDVDDDILRAWEVRYDIIRARRKSTFEMSKRLNIETLDSKFYNIYKKPINKKKNKFILDTFGEGTIEVGRINFLGWKALFKVSGLEVEKKRQLTYNYYNVNYPLYVNQDFTRGYITTSVNSNMIINEPCNTPPYNSSNSYNEFIDPFSQESSLNSSSINSSNSYNEFIAYSDYSPQFITASNNNSTLRLSNFDSIIYNQISNQRVPFNTNIIRQLSILKFAVEWEIAHYTRNYDLIEPSKEWLDSQKSQIAKITRQEDQLVVYDMTEEQVSKRKRYVKLSELERFTGFILFGFEENGELLYNFVQLIKRSKKYCPNRSIKYSKAVKIILVAKTTGKQINQLKNSIHVEKFIGDNRVFKHFATALTINKESKIHKFPDYSKDHTHINFKEILPLICKEQEENARNLAHFQDEYLGYHEESLDENFVDSIIQVAKQFNLFDKEIYEKHLSFNNYLSKVDLIFNLHFNFEMLPYLIDYFVIKGKQVHEIWVKPEQYEIDLIKETLIKIDYIREVEENNLLNNKEEVQCKSLLNYYNYARQNNN